VTKWVLLTGVLTLAMPAAPRAQERPGDSLRLRNHIQVMEGVLARAVGLGAQEVARQLQLVDPRLTVMTVMIGQPRARGFVLEGYGVFFDVEIPDLSQSAVWSTVTVQRDMQIGNALESLRRLVESIPEGPGRQQAQQTFLHIQRQLGPAQQAGATQAQAPSAQPPKGVVVATEANQDTPAPIPIMDDPRTQYVEAVKRQLIDAMLDHSLPMDLSPDEWLTVAARGSGGPLVPGEIYDPMTIILRVRGSDLAVYAADRTKRDEIRKKVEWKVF
jgi:hypothetical protein